MIAALLTIEPEKVFARPNDTLADDEYKLMLTLSDLADRELVATIGWAKQVPGFWILVFLLLFFYVPLAHVTSRMFKVQYIKWNILAL